MDFIYYPIMSPWGKRIPFLHNLLIYFFLCVLRMPSAKFKIIGNTIANILMQFWVYIVGLVLFPIIVHYIGLEDYGIYLLVGGLAGSFGLAEFAVSGALTKYIAEFNAKKDNRTINEMINSTFVFFLLVGLIICTLLFLIGVFFPYLFNVSGSTIEKARVITFLVGITALITWSMQSFKMVLPGLQRYDVRAIILSVGATINGVGTIVLLVLGYGIYELIILAMFVTAGTQISFVIAAKKLLPYLEIRLKPDTLVLGLFVAISTITLYTVAAKINTVIGFLAGIPQSALLPAAAEMEAKNEQDMIRSLVFRGGKYSCAFTLAVIVAIFPLVGPLIRYWMGEEFIEMIPITQVYISYWFLIPAFGTLASILKARERLKELVAFFMLIAVSNLILSLILVQFFDIWGVILGTVIPYFVLQPIWLPIALKIVGIDLKTYLKRVILPTYPIAAVALVILMVFVYFIPPINLVLVMVYMGIGFFFYLSLFYFLGMKKEERSEFFDYLRDTLNKKMGQT